MEFSGKTVQEAIELGLKEMGLTEETATITVKEEPTKGLFGRLKGKAVVEIEKNKNGAEKATEFVQGILDIMDITAKAELTEDGENPVITLIAEDSSTVIGYRGEVLDALQTLAGAVANIGNKVYKKVVVDCENYRDRREETLVSLAHKLEEKATKMRREVILEPMNPFERRIIHTALAESQTVTTRSDGKEPERYVVIVPNDKDEFAKPYNAGRNNDKSKNNNKKGGKFNRNDRKGRNDHRQNGFRKNDRPRGSGFTEEKRKKTIGFGTYLGNSLKDNK
ncbi:MAG: protein jag [Clostridiales bacterium]|nr:protein jag [Clostridiales bacterium]